MLGVAYEAERRPGFCSHVATPEKPTMLFGCAPSQAVRLAGERAEQAVDADRRRLRIDAKLLVAGVASFPMSWSDLGRSPTDQWRYLRWLDLLVGFLKKYHGDALCFILLHTDERYPHAHWGAVPALEADGRMRIETLHPGEKAFNRVRATGGSNNKGRQAYQQAMRDWQDQVHRAVYAPVGIARIGPRRQRLSPSERKARAHADATLARTLAAEQELKAGWRKDIHAQLSAGVSAELEHWRRRCLALEEQLAGNDAEIARLRLLIEELQSLAGPASGLTP